VRALAHTDKIFDGNETNGKTENDVDRDETSELKPGEGCAIDAEPQRLARDHVGVGRRLIGKAAMKKIHDWEKRAGDPHERENEESPTRPDEREGLRDEVD